MDRDKIVLNTMLKLAGVNPADLIRLLDQVEAVSNAEFIFNKVHSFIKQKAKKEDDVKVIYDRLKKVLHGPSQEKALKMLEKEFPFVVS